MSVEQQKAAVFVARLLQNPGLSGLTPLQKEEQILQFLAKNSSQLYPTLTSNSFFPGWNWEQVWKLLTQVLYQEINKVLLPNLQSIINDKIDLSYIPFFRQQHLPFPKIKQQMFDFMSNLLQKAEARRGFTGAYSALVYNFSERYISEVFSRKEYVHFELTKVQRLNLPREEMLHLINSSILFRPLVHMMSSSEGSQQNSGMSIVQAQFAEKIFQTVKLNLQFLPEQVVRSGVFSNVPFTENRKLEATARITALFSSRCRNYNPAMKVDRGADTADKSWFSIARRNYKFYGYDIKMLDEFYKIAAENGW